MGARLYVGGLPTSASEREIKELFSAFGTVETVRVIKDRATGRPRGFAFVVMSTPLEARRALNALHSSRAFEHGLLIVNQARPREVRTSRAAVG